MAIDDTQFRPDLLSLERLLAKACANSELPFRLQIAALVAAAVRISDLADHNKATAVYLFEMARLVHDGKCMETER